MHGNYLNEFIDDLYHNPEKEIAYNGKRYMIAQRFGRVDFEPIDDNDKGHTLAYLMKYIEKDGEKIVYSKGLPHYFISDVADEDVVCPYDENELKYVLNDKFTCYDYGEIGTVSPEVIEKMPTRQQRKGGMEYRTCGGNMGEMQAG